MLLFLVSFCFNFFFTSPLDNENVSLRHALAIPTGVPIEIIPLIADKTVKEL